MAKIPHNLDLISRLLIFDFARSRTLMVIGSTELEEKMNGKMDEVGWKKKNSWKKGKEIFSMTNDGDSFFIFCSSHRFSELVLPFFSHGQVSFNLY